LKGKCVDCPDCNCPFASEEVLVQVRRIKCAWVGCRNYREDHRRRIEANPGMLKLIWHWAALRLSQLKQAGIQV